MSVAKIVLGVVVAVGLVPVALALGLTSVRTWAMRAFAGVAVVAGLAVGLRLVNEGHDERVADRRRWADRCIDDGGIPVNVGGREFEGYCRITGGGQ